MKIHSSCHSGESQNQVSLPTQPCHTDLVRRRLTTGRALSQVREPVQLL